MRQVPVLAGVWYLNGGWLGAGTRIVEIVNWRYEHEGERSGFGRDTVGARERKES